MNQPRYFLRMVSLLTAVLLLGLRPSAAQNVASLPPHVIDVQPIPGVEMSSNEPLTIFFDQPMQPSSVTLNFEPSLSGNITWIDEHTLVFLPKNEIWPTNKHYAVTLNGTATSGLVMESAYEFEVQGPRSLSVAAVTPEEGAEGIATEGAQISVTFDRPVVPLVSTVDQATLPSPLTFSPAVSGRGEWVNSSAYVFTASGTDLAGNTRYTATVTAGLIAVDGTILEEPFRWSFRTLAPQVIDVKPTQIFKDKTALLDTGFEIVFSQPMDHESTEAAFQLSDQGDATYYSPNPDLPKIDGQFHWDAQSKTMTFQPNALLNPGYGYSVNLDTTARSASGAAVLAKPIQEYFYTVGLPRASLTYPSNRDRIRPGLQRIEFSFNTKMKTSTFEGRYIVSPKPVGEVTPYVYDDSILALEFQHEVDVTYTITLLAGMADIYGNVTENDFSTTYTVRANEDLARSGASLAINSEFSLASAYNKEILLPLHVQGSPKITLSIYRTDLETVRSMKHDWSPYYYYGFNQSLYGYYDYEKGWLPTVPAWVKPENLLHMWTQTLEQTKPNTNMYVPLTLENGASLPIGFYGVELVSPDSYNPNDSKTGFLLAVINTAITIKKSTDGTLAWVTDIASGKPVPHAQIQVWGDTASPVKSGQTDADGIYQIPDTYPSTYVTVQSGSLFGAWFDSTTLKPTTFESYLYMDRPIYRPSETVYFRGVLRDKNDVTYTIPDIDKIHAKVEFGYSNVSYNQEAATSIYESDISVVKEYGTFSGSFEIPKDAIVGHYALQIGPVCDPNSADCQSFQAFQNVQFEIADFRVPEYEVKVTAQRPEIIQGEPLNTLVEANYYFGSPVNNAKVSWTVRNSGYYASYFRYSGPEQGFRFQDNNYYDYGIENQEPVQVQADARGQALYTQSVKVSYFHPANVMVEATVSDETDQPVSARTNILVHPAAVYIGLRSAKTFNTFGQPIKLDILTVTPDSVLQPNQTVQLEIVETRWVRKTVDFGQYNWESKEIPVTSTSVTTDKNGKASYTFNVPNTGIFLVRAKTKDAQNRENRSALWVYVRDNVAHGNGGSLGDPFNYTINCGFSPEYRTLKLTADKDQYVPGDVAEVLIPNPYDEPATALITVERQSMMHREVTQITGDSLLYRLPLTDEYAPTVYLNVLLIRGASAENPNPDSVRGDIQINVEPVNRRLNIELDSSTAEAKPGETVHFNVHLTDSQGHPVVGEVGLALTDEAVLALRPPNSSTLENTFYNTQPLQVETSVAVRALLSVPDNTMQAGCGGGGGDAPVAATIRDDFEYTPLWTPHVVTDADGRATVSVQLPDNLTRWRLDARAVTTDTRVGQGQIDITSSLPLMVRPVAPRFFVVGDRLPLAALINNNTDQVQIVTTRIEATGVTIEKPAEIKDLEVPPGGRVRVEWPVTVQDTTGVSLTVFVSSESGLQDAAKPSLTTGDNGTIPVFHYTAPDTVATGGVLLNAGSRVEGISLPPRFAHVEGTLTLQLDPSIAATTIDGLNYLRNFPHQCIEQTVSRFYPNAVTYNALHALSLDDPQLATNLHTAIDQGYSILLSGQNKDGGWGWFTQMESNSYVTAYALLGLREAKKTEFEVDAKMLGNALAYLRRQVSKPTLQTETWMLNRQAFLLYVLGLYDQTSQSQLDALYEYRLKISLAGRSYLLMAYHEIAPQAEAVATLTSDLTSALILSANSAHWEEKDIDWYNWGSDTRTTALGLLALARVQPDQPLLPNIVRWLMIARRGDRWETTQETAWAVIALTEWMVNTGELKGDYDLKVQLNDNELVNREVTPETVREGQTIQVNVADLLHDQINRLAIDRTSGPGALYYSAILNLELPANQVSAISRGVQVAREYSIGTSRQTVDTAHVGDTVTVRVTINVPQDVYYFTLEDALPAGLEILDRNLLTTAQAGDNPQLKRLYTDDPYWYWRWWYFDRTELRDRGAVLYADYLPKGTYIYTYQARATTLGEFQTLPAQGYAFYQSDIFGRTNGAMFTVLP